MTQIPPGWHPDPAGPTPGQPPMLRYWDGTAWTEHVAPVQPAPAPYGQPFGQRRVQPFGAPYGVRAARPGPTTPDGQPLAGWWWRVLGYLIDTVIVGIVADLISVRSQADLQRDLQTLSDELQRRSDATPSDPQFGLFLDGMAKAFHDHALGLFLPSLVVGLLYFGVLLRWRGATVGQLAVGLRVRLRDTPGRLPWGAIALRVTVQVLIANLLTLLAFASGSFAVFALLTLAASVFSLLNYLWPLWDDKRQALHDKAARTNVVRVR
ncbi:RDD family protein [Nocardioides sp. AN3]